MYCRPHLIWVAGLLCQSEPALAILEPGSDCGMPYAPEEPLVACAFQPLYLVHSESRQPNWPELQP